jgi:hypothetical protein
MSSVQTTQHYTAREYGRALSTALEALGAAAEERDRAIDVMVRSRDAEEMLAALEVAAATPVKVDSGMAAIARGLPPEDHETLHTVYLLAMKALFEQWPAEVTAFGFKVMGQDHDAALKAGEARCVMAVFFHWWEQFQLLIRLMERDVPDLARALRLTATARCVIDKEDWVRTFQGDEIVIGGGQ